MKYAHIDRSRHLWPVRLQGKVLEVSFTGYRSIICGGAGLLRAVI